MPETAIIPEVVTDKSTPPKYTLPYRDQLIIQIIKDDPSLSNLAIQKELNRLGEKCGTNYVYQRLNKSELLRREVNDIRHFAQQFIDRELVPKALKLHLEVLNAKTIPPLKKKDFIFKAEDLGFKLDPAKRQKRGDTINIKELQILVTDKIRGA